MLENQSSDLKMRIVV